MPVSATQDRSAPKTAKQQDTPKKRLALSGRYSGVKCFFLRLLFHLHFLQFPLASSKSQHPDHSNRRLRNRNRCENPVVRQSRMKRQPPRDRQLARPEAKQVDQRRRDGVARAVEGLDRGHAPGVGNITTASSAE